MSHNCRWRFAALIVALAVIAALAWNWRAWQAKAEVGAGYGARMTCSCRYVEGREMGSCNGDTEPGMEIVSISDSPGDRSVTARVPLMAKRTARFRAGFGCLLDGR